jgi:hypothetical protein
MYRRFVCIVFSGFMLFCFSFCQVTQIRQKADDAFNELSEQKFTLRFFNALNGTGIADAIVAIEDVGNLRTDAEGKVLFTTSLENDQLKVSFSSKGYINSDFAIEIMAGTIFFNRL